MNWKDEIVRFAPACRQEVQTQQETLTLAQQLGEKFLLRENAAAHVTVGAMVLNPAMTHALMAHHPVYDALGWPGGHADGQDDLLMAAWKEAKEETGAQRIYPLSGVALSMETLPCPAHIRHGVSIPAHLHYNVSFGFIAPDRQPLPECPEETGPARWVPIDRLETFCREAHMIPIYRKLIKHMRAIKQEKDAVYAALPASLLAWYAKNARPLPWRENRDPYRVWLSEIMLQQTRVEAVKGYYARFLSALPDIKSLAEAKEETLMKLWEGLGYYTRARNLQKAAQVIQAQYAGCFPSRYEDIAALPGIGEYTAGAIASICFEQPTPAVDGNVLRVVARLTERFEPVTSPTLKREITQSLRDVYPTGHCGNFTQSLMELGATVCLPGGAPKCELCPVAALCMARRNGDTWQLPVREAKKPRRQEDLTVFFLNCGDRIALRRRPASGLLAGLWELPHVSGHLTAEEAAAALSDWQLSTQGDFASCSRVHIFTHVQWNMLAYRFECVQENADFIWAPVSELTERYALPTAFRQFLPAFLPSTSIKTNLGD